MSEISAIAQSWNSTPYHHQARVKGVGVDCAQLIGGVYEEWAGKSVSIPQDYSPEWHLHNKVEKMVEILLSLGCIEKPVEETEPDDILCFKFGRVCSHLGIFLHANMFIHARIDQKKVVINSLSGDWKDRHVRTFSFPPK